MSDDDEAPASRRNLVPFHTAVRAWFLISLQTFGGPAGQIAVMQRTLVDELRWIGQRRFLHALNYCMILPGPEALGVAAYSFGMAWIIGTVIQKTMGFRINTEDEVAGVDTVVHGEASYALVD